MTTATQTKKITFYKNNTSVAPEMTKISISHFSPKKGGCLPQPPTLDPPLSHRFAVKEKMSVTIFHYLKKRMRLSLAFEETRSPLINNIRCCLAHLSPSKPCYENIPFKAPGRLKKGFGTQLATVRLFFVQLYGMAGN
jgi:hypothetical protein